MAVRTKGLAFESGKRKATGTVKREPRGNSVSQRCYFVDQEAHRPEEGCGDGATECALYLLTRVGSEEA